MVNLKTTVEKTILDKRQKVIGNFNVYVTVQKLELDINSIIAIGYYYYINEGSIVKLTDFRTILLWETISQIESYVLEPLNVETLKDAILKRTLEFTFLQIQQENGQNFNILYDELEQV